MNYDSINYEEGFTPENDLDDSYHGMSESDYRMERRRTNRAQRPSATTLYDDDDMIAASAPAPDRHTGTGQPRAPKPAPKQPAAEQPTAPKPKAAPAQPAPAQPRKPKPAPAPKERKPNFFISLYHDERMHAFLAVVLAIISIFVIIAAFSHFQHGGTDQSIITNMTIDEAVHNNMKVSNLGGPFGAWLSHVLLCDALGLGSLVLVPYLWILALALFKVRRCNFWGTTFRCLLVAVTISIVLGLVTYNTDSIIFWGGNHGHYINKFFIDRTTIIGAVMLSFALVTAVACVYLNELRTVWNKSRESIGRAGAQLAYERQRLRERQQNNMPEGAGHDYEFEEQASDEQPDDEASDDETPEIKPIEIPLLSKIKKRLQGSEVKAAANTDDQRHNAPDNAAGVSVSAASHDETTLQTAETTLVTDDGSIVIDGGEGADFVVHTGNADEEAINIDSSAEKDELKPYDHRAELSHYRFPTIDLLEDRPSGPSIDMEEQQANKHRIEETLLRYNIGISRIEATVGPTVTLYEIVPAEGVRISQIKRLEDDIALSLSAIGIRIIAPIPGKGTVGIEVPNNDPKTVSMRSVIASRKFQECKMALPMAMGATISNDIFIADLAKMPHLLVAGATGMGKSVGLNVIIGSLLYKKHPSELKLVLIDPKMVEFSLYSKLERHYLAKLPNQEDAIITDMRNVVETLNSLCVEMDNRYELLRNANVRSLEEYNKKFTERRLNPEKGHKYLPYIVVVVDEFADLIMTQGKEIETPIARIAQKARAVGIHMILATQRPSTNVITGLIKANFPGRIAFRVIQMVDSRTILDCPGANQLIGRGDMLFSHNGSMERVQCAFISTEEVERLTESIDDQVGFTHAYLLPEYVPDESEGGIIAGASTERDAIFNDAARFVVSKQMGSTSSLQRQFGIGYNRAGKLMDQLEAAGIVGPVNGSKPRNILVDLPTLDAMLGE